MITIKDYLEAIDYRITGGSEYQWNCFGPDARYLDCDKDGAYSTNIIFDSKTSEVYVAEMWDYINDKEYRWINPDYLQALKDEYREREEDFDSSFDDHKFINLEVEDDILEKIKAIVNGEEYDTRIKVPLTLSDNELFDLMKLAHEQDVTLNQLVEGILRDAIDNAEMLRDWK